MRTAIILCSLAALAAATLGLKLGWPDDAQRRHDRAHNEIEQIAFRKDGTEELQQAVTHERAVDEELSVDRFLGKGMIGMSVGCSGVVVVLSLLALRKKAPNPSSPTSQARASSF